MEKTKDVEEANRDERIPCPVCGESIYSSARKCIHCGELVGTNKSLRYFTTQLVGYVGVFTAILSTFYALREGYFYVQKQQQAREEVRSFQAVSKHFENNGSLDYAEQALQKAVDVRPNDRELKQHLFLLRCRRLFDEIEWQNLLSDQQIERVKELILEGHRLQQDPLEDDINAKISLALGRLIPQDGSWNDGNTPREQFERAMTLSGGDSETAFRYGQWLIASETDVEAGAQLMKLAIGLNAADALYHYELARHYEALQHYQPVLALLQTAISLRDQQTDLVRIQASNFAKTALRGHFLRVAHIHDISSDDFLGLSEKQRRDWIVQLLEYKPTDRDINRYATDFYLSTGELEEAMTSVSFLVSERDLAEPVRGYTLEDKERYLAVLTARNENIELQQLLREDIKRFRESQNWDEFLHWGIVGRHRYKVGLRLDKRMSKGGLRVLKVFSGFPFAKAGFKEGDILMKAGHQNVRSLNDVMIVMDKFNPGNDMPFELLRGSKSLTLNLVVE